LARTSPRLARAEPASGDPVLASDNDEKESQDMYKIAAIIGGVLLLAGVALAGAVTSLGSTESPTLSKLPLAAATTGTATTARQDDRGGEAEARGPANEPNEDLRGRANEPNEDLRGPCDEAEHANDPRCTGAGTTTITTRDDDNRGPNRGHDDGADHVGGNSGPGGSHGGHGDDD
jgi:hypothetical protein